MIRLIQTLTHVQILLCLLFERFVTKVKHWRQAHR